MQQFWQFRHSQRGMIRRQGYNEPPAIDCRLQLQEECSASFLHDRGEHPCENVIDESPGHRESRGSMLFSAINSYVSGHFQVFTKFKRFDGKKLYTFTSFHFSYRCIGASIDYSMAPCRVIWQAKSRIPLSSYSSRLRNRYSCQNCQICLNVLLMLQNPRK